MPFRLKKSDTEIKQVLSERGIADPVIEYVTEDAEAPQSYEMLTWLVVMLWFVGIFIGAQFLWPFLVDISKSAALANAKTTNAILFDYSFGPALLLGAMAWVFICLSIPGLILGFKPSLKKSVFTGLVSDKMNGFVVRHFLKKTHADKNIDLSEPKKFVASFFDKITSFMEWQAILLSAFTGIFMYLEFQAHTIVTRQSVQQDQLFPFMAPNVQILSGAEFVELGCNYTDEEMSHLNYTIHFPDGTKVDLGATFPVEGNWIDQAEIIDKILVQSKIEFRRWTWPGRQSLHSKCIDRYAAEFGANGYERVNTLLRVDQF